MHAHLVQEGQLDSEQDYEDWLADANTWLVLADKCALHQMFPLAADFYALAITRDPEAFKKPMIWYRFSKACHRSGRRSDAQLAVKVSILLEFHFGCELSCCCGWRTSLASAHPQPAVRAATSHSAHVERAALANGALVGGRPKHLHQ